MNYLVLGLFITLAAADRLDNIYLPPSRAASAGGHGNILQTPFKTSGESQQSGSTQYAAHQRDASAYIRSGVSAGQTSSGPSTPPVAILRFNNDNNADGNYQFGFETENQISQQETGQLKNAGTDDVSSSVQGSYSYTGPDGQVYTVNYIADEFGFRATGDHIPTPPPVPVEIQKALEKNAADEAAGIIDDGQYHGKENSYAKNNQKPVNREYLAPTLKQNTITQKNTDVNGYRY